MTDKQFDRTILVTAISVGTLLTIAALFATSAFALTDCQKYVIQNWPRYNLTSWSIAAGAGDNCYVSIPTLADTNEIADDWVNEVAE